MTVDYKRYPVLYVDDEAHNLVTFRYSLEERFTILTAGTGAEAIEILRNQEIAILFADQRMPGMTGVELCAHALVIRPDTIRVIITAFADAHDAIAAINQGRVSQYLHKPWKHEELVEIIESCIDLVHVQRNLRDIEQRLFRSAHAAADARHRLAHEVGSPLGAVAFAIDEATKEIGQALEFLAGLEVPRVRAARERLTEAVARFDIAHHALRMANGVRVRHLEAEHQPVRPEAPVCDAASVVDSVVRVVRDSVGSGTEMRVVLNGMPVVKVPASVFGQIVLNLVTNAAQAVQAGARPERQVTVGVDLDGATAVLRLADTGPGIRAEDLTRIFEPHFTTKPDGMGLGLSIVRELVERAGGSIRVQSSPGAGATFEVRLPAAPPP